MTAASEVHAPVRVRIPADIEAPDRVLFGLTARQVAVLAAAAAPLYLVWQGLASRVPLVVLALVTAPPVAVAVAVALGRRDGLPLDAWLVAAVRHVRGPRRLTTPAGVTDAVPEWAPPQTPAPHENPEDERGRLGPLQLPITAIDAGGPITTSSGSMALVAASTLNLALRTDDEQAALIGGFGRWLNSLAGPVQIVMSARRVDMTDRAQRAADRTQLLPHPALAAAATDYAAFLMELDDVRQPLARSVVITCRADTRPGSGHQEALQRAERTAAALQAIGAQARVLDGTAAAGVLAAAADPYSPTAQPWPRTPSTAPVRGGFADAWTRSR